MQPEKQESTWHYEVLAWLELNRNLMIAAGTIVLALIVAGYIYLWSRQQAELRANDALFALKPRTAVAENEKAASAADFLKIAQEYSSSAAADRALILAAGDLYREGRYAEAQAQFQKALEQDRRGLLAPMAALGVAASLDAQDQTDAALKAYQSVAAEYSDAPASARAKFAMALLHEARSEPEQALKIYEELTAARNQGRASMEASVKREALLKSHPHLARTNTPVAFPPIQVTAPTNAAPATDADAASAPTNKIAGQP